MPPVIPVDLLEGPMLVLSGRVVTMDDQFKVLPRGRVYIDKGVIRAVQDADGPAPPGFEAARVVATEGTMYPGLIELHNHLSYNVLRLWAVPKKFTNRDQWGRIADYGRLITGPMKVLGQTADLLPALIRYVECKCLLGGVTTSQGIELFSNHGGRRYYRGIVRNVEATDDPELPEAAAKIADVEATDAKRFMARLMRQTCFLLHLSEGTDDAARKHFRALEIEGADWAITPALSGIHCAALKPDDFEVLGARKGSMVWSPLSNLLLYGATADVRSARSHGVRIALGSDWSPTGSKNLLGELKVAWLASVDAGNVFTERDIVAMATREAAAVLGWQKVLGSIEPNKRADILVLDGETGDPYKALLRASETSIRLVVINGMPRFGHGSLMKSLGVSGESVRVGGRARTINLEQANTDPVVGAISLSKARKTLTDALHRLPKLAKDLERGRSGPTRAALRGGPPTWFLALDELADTGIELRPRLPLPGRRRPSGPSVEPTRAAVPFSQIAEPLTLDPLTVVDDEDFLNRIEAQTVLPEFVRTGLRDLYS
jgi:5-methylthioadenosine/S-adenosylhomocysteine deaminase